MTWTLATQLPCITMSPIKWDYWLRTRPCSLSTNLVFTAAWSCRTSQGFQVTRQSLARGPSTGGQKDGLFVGNCTGQHISMVSLIWAFCLWGMGREAKGSHRGLGAANVRLVAEQVQSPASPANSSISGLQCEAPAENITGRPPGRKQTRAKSLWWTFLVLKHLTNF